MDQLSVTEHPVEFGAPVSDHAFRRPAEITMKCGWSNSSSFKIAGFAVPFISQGLVSSALSLGGTDYVTEVYETLLKLQRSLEPFSVTAGKRSYKNMLMESLAVTTDGTSENALMVVTRMREVIIVTAVTRASPPAAQQAQPGTTQGTTQGGPASTQAGTPPPNSGPTPSAVPSTAQTAPVAPVTREPLPNLTGASQGAPAAPVATSWFSPSGVFSAGGVA